MLKRFLAALFLLPGPALADQSPVFIPETSTALTGAFNLPLGQGSLDNYTHYALNPALRSITGNFSGASCSGIASPVPWQWCMNTSTRQMQLYTSNSSTGVFSWNNAFSINPDGTIAGTSGGGGTGGALGANPTFTGEMDGGAGSGYVGGYYWAQGNDPYHSVYNYGAGTDAHAWKWTTTADGTMHLCAWNDAATVCNDAISATRSGSTVTGINFGVPISSLPSGMSGDGTTDNCTPLNSALSNGGNGANVNLPQPAALSGFYRSSCTIVIPEGSTLEGNGAATFWAISGTVGGVEIRCDAGVSPCVQMGATGSLTNATAAIRKVQIRRAGATNTLTTNIGLLLQGGHNMFVEDVSVDNSGQCIKLKTPPGTGAGISVFFSHIRTTRCRDVYLWNDSYPEVRVMHSRFGGNAAAGIPANAFIRVSCTQNNCTGAGAPNTMVFTNNQFNTAGGTDQVGTLWDFTNMDSVNGYDAADYGIWVMSDNHVETVNHAFQSDATWPQIKSIQLSNNTIVTAQDFWNLNAATNLWRAQIAGNLLVGIGGFTLNGTPSTRPMLQEFIMTGNNVGGNATINGTSNGGGGSTAFLVNNNWENNLTLSGGTWANLTMIGGSVSNTYSNTATGNVNVFFDRQTEIGGTVGATCTSGVSATTGRTKNGLITAC